jgi:hypothetical protein
MNGSPQDENKTNFLEERLGRIKELFTTDYILEAIDLVKQTGNHYLE